jgi:hypothetical protein
VEIVKSLISTNLFNICIFLFVFVKRRTKARRMKSSQQRTLQEGKFMF